MKTKVLDGAVVRNPGVSAESCLGYVIKRLQRDQRVGLRWDSGLPILEITLEAVAEWQTLQPASKRE
jgi:hypothetical protein